MSHFCGAHVNNDASKPVLVVLRRVLLRRRRRGRSIVSVRFLALLSRFQILLLEVRLRVRFQVDFIVELAIVINLSLGHRFQVELEPLQHNNEHIRKLLDALPLQCRHLLIALLAEVRVLTCQHLALDKRSQAFDD